jgi:hypothetical protein
MVSPTPAPLMDSPPFWFGYVDFVTVFPSFLKNISWLVNHMSPAIHLFFFFLKPYIYINQYRLRTFLGG